MDAIEKAIRNAFEKGNAEDRAFREKVYRSAFAALDRVLQANPNVTVEAAINRRKAVQAKIAEIESEFLPAVQAVPDVMFPSESGNAAPAPAVDTPNSAPFSPWEFLRKPPTPDTIPAMSPRMKPIPMPLLQIPANPVPVVR